FEISGAPVPAPPALPAKLRTIEPLGAPAMKRRLAFGEQMKMGAGGMSTAFVIDGRSFDPKRVDVRMTLGAVELWEFANPTDMDHPFHVHGTQFQVVEFTKPGQVTRPGYRAWK